MSRAYKFRDQTRPYFVTLTTVKWVDVFTRKEYCEEILSSLKFCQQHKGLIVYAWVIMSNHVHLIIGTRFISMENIMRDLKKHTSVRIKELISCLPTESRKEWMLGIFREAGKSNSNNYNWQFWQQHNQPIELSDNYMIESKLEYLHNNPVNAGVVFEPWDYRWSSAGRYAGKNELLEIEFID